MENRRITSDLRRVHGGPFATMAHAIVGETGRERMTSPGGLSPAHARSGRSDTSRAVHALIQIAQNTGGDTPDVTLLVRHPLVLAPDTLPGAPVALVLFGPHEKGERHPESVRDLRPLYPA